MRLAFLHPVPLRGYYEIHDNFAKFVSVDNDSSGCPLCPRLRVVVLRAGDDVRDVQAQLTSTLDAAQRANVMVLRAGAALGAASSTRVRQALTTRDRAELMRLCGPDVASALLPLS